MSLLIRQVSCDSELENTLETERKRNGGVTWIVMSSWFGLEKKKKTSAKILQSHSGLLKRYKTFPA